MDYWQSRTAKIIGYDCLNKLKNSHILIAGLGGVGSWVAESLARSGVGQLTIIDFDTVDESNINRQMPALITTVGCVKTRVVKERLLSINKDIIVNELALKLDKNNIEDILKCMPDYVVDAIDLVSCKIALIEKCVKLGIKVISSMGAGNRILPAGFIVADISKTYNCPLARTVRLRLRKDGIKKGVKTVFNTNLPLTNFYTAESAPGSMMFAPAVCGLTIAAEVVNDLIK